MKAAVLVFPGSNCDRDLAVALERAGADVSMVWHKETALPEGLDFVGVPGGFSYGDYLRCGAIAANSPICQAVVKHAEAGGFVFGVCNGFQILTETGLLPGALRRNAGLKYICRTVGLKVATTDSAFTAGYAKGDEIMIPIAHHDGNYYADGCTTKMALPAHISLTNSAFCRGCACSAAAGIAAACKLTSRVSVSCCTARSYAGEGRGDEPGVELVRAASLEAHLAATPARVQSAGGGGRI